MDKAIQPLLTEAAKYGLAFVVMSVFIIVLIAALIALWKYGVKRDNKMNDLIERHITAFKDLESAIENNNRIIMEKL